ncbi:hypothetical protein ART_1213 [Arthrobacter sp. PAMC 25486]|uniref:hypothetical protein n=1 Tax=Arthrobacter sp. PAMC 25486 TaxID=1494608 RepID=UPI000535C704|nr:hypothetical protein [Arthrobacter sp. PAMC 25486]AIY00812.1 hypothetical protein ART_1213 [Arthrobacter sp. PAMC 25486]
MTNPSRRYAMNFGWVWGPNNMELDKKASLALKLRGADPAQLNELLDGWLEELIHDEESGSYYQGGFSVEVQSRGQGSADIIFASGGQDVADSLGYAVDGFHDSVLEQLDTAEVTWTELPLES